MQLQSGLYTEDMRQVVKHTSSLFPSLRIYATGWSLGGNILVRYLGEVSSFLQSISLDLLTCKCISVNKSGDAKLSNWAGLTGGR